MIVVQVLVYAHNKAFKRNKNSGLRFASLHIITHNFCPLNAALCVNSGGIVTVKQREFKIILNLVGVYVFFLIGIATPLVLTVYNFESFGSQYKLIVPAISVLLVNWFHKSAFGLLEETGSFAIPGVYELRQKHLLHVNRIEKYWLLLAISAVVFSAF